VGQRTALKNRRQERTDSRTVAQMQARQLRQLDRDIAKLEEEIKQVLREDPALQRDFDLLVSIDGVGFITAMTVLAEIGDLRRFERARQLTAYVGVSLQVVQSGSSVRGKTRMCKRGNARTRQALYLSAMGALKTKHPNTLSGMYLHLRDEGKEPRATMGAVMRKQLTIMRAVVVSGKPYDPAWKPCAKRSGQVPPRRTFSS
jgi:transposase